MYHTSFDPFPIPHCSRSLCILFENPKRDARTLCVSMDQCEAGDIERYLGSNTINISLSILHCNIRSIRNKLDYITENLLDFDILFFCKSHLDANISSSLSSKYDIPYRKDRTNHGGGLFMHLSCKLANTRVKGLETFKNESLWVEIKVNWDIYLIGLFHTSRTADTLFLNSLNKNIENVLDTTNNIIILEDMN